MKKSIFLSLALLMAGLTMADERIYVMADERTISDPTWVSQLPDDINSTMYLWIRDLSWGDGSLTCNLNMSSDAGPSGFTYYIFTPAPDNAGNIGGYYGLGYVSQKAIDMTAVNEDWILNIIVKSNAPFIRFTFGDGTNEVELLLHELIGAEGLDNTTWHHLQIPFYELQDLGLDWSNPIPEGKQWFAILTNDNTAAKEQLCIDAVYFSSEMTDGIEEIRMNADAAKKVLIDGQIVIKRGQQLFNALGQEL